VFKKNILFPFYHIISNEDVPHVKHLYKFRNVTQFKKDLDFFFKKRESLDLLEFAQIIKEKKEIPKNKVVLTFDDGFREIYDVVAPILIQKGINATFFINSGFFDNKDIYFGCKLSLLYDYIINKKHKANYFDLCKIYFEKHNLQFKDFQDIFSIHYLKKNLIDTLANQLGINFNDHLKNKQPYMTSIQVQTLIDQGFYIGAHSVDHPLYSLISEKEQLNQTFDSIKTIKEKFNLSYSVFAFPHNHHGVSKENLRKIGNSVDLFFGTDGLLYKNKDNFFQRFGMEGTNLPAPLMLFLMSIGVKDAYKIIKKWRKK